MATFINGSVYGGNSDTWRERLAIAVVCTVVGTVLGSGLQRMLDARPPKESEAAADNQPDSGPSPAAVPPRITVSDHP